MSDRRIMGHLATNQTNPREILTNSDPEPIDDRTNPKITHERCTELNHEYRTTSKTQPEIAAQYNVSPNTVYHHLHRCKCGERSQADIRTGNIDDRRCNLIRILVEEGTPYRKVERILGVRECSDTAKYHAHGECSCNADIPPVTRPPSEVSEPDRNGDGWFI